jgi:hypothetical protein
MMPQRALPIPHNPALRTLETVVREYRDLLQRPLSGTLTLAAAAPFQEGRVTVSSAAVKVPVVDGVLALDLPPGSYVLRGQLWSKDEQQTPIEETFTVGEEE